MPKAFLLVMCNPSKMMKTLHNIYKLWLQLSFCTMTWVFLRFNDHRSRNMGENVLNLIWRSNLVQGHLINLSMLKNLQRTCMERYASIHLDIVDSVFIIFKWLYYICLMQYDLKHRRQWRNWKIKENKALTTRLMNKSFKRYFVRTWPIYKLTIILGVKCYLAKSTT